MRAPLVLRIPVPPDDYIGVPLEKRCVYCRGKGVELGTSNTCLACRGEGVDGLTEFGQSITALCERWVAASSPGAAQRARRARVLRRLPGVRRAMARLRVLSRPRPGEPGGAAVTAPKLSARCRDCRHPVYEHAVGADASLYEPAEWVRLPRLAKYGGCRLCTCESRCLEAA